MRKRVKNIISLGVMVILLSSVVGVFPPVQGFTPNVIRTNLSNDSENSQLPEIAVEGNNVYVVWFDNKDILYRKSTDNGATFGSVIDIGNTGGVQATETFTLNDNALETDGSDTVNLDTRSYVFRSTLSVADLNSDNIVVLGSTASETLDNLVAAINLGTGNGTKFVVKSQHATVSATKATASTITVTAKIAGTSGNSITASLSVGLTEGTLNDGDNVLNGGLAGATRPNPQIIVKDDNVFITWLDGNDIKFRRSVGGNTFSEAEKSFGVPGTVGISFLSGQPFQRITNSSGNNIYLAWFNDVDNTYRFVNSTDSGDTFPWTPASLGSHANSAVVKAGLELSAAGSNVHAILVEGTNINTKTSTNFGDTFGANNTLGVRGTNSPSKFAQPVVVADGTSVHAMWKDDGTSRIMRSANSSNSGVGFNPPGELGSNIGTFVSSEDVIPKISVENSVNVYYAWENSGEIVFHNSTNSGQTIKSTGGDPKSPTNLSNTGGEASDLVDMDASNSLVHLVWREKPAAANDADIFYKLLVRNALTSCSAVDLSENDVFSTDPKVASIGSKVYTVWEEHPTSTTTSGGDIIFTAGTVGNACISWGATQYTTSEAAAALTITTAPGTASPISATITSTKTGQSITPSIPETGGAGSGIFSTTITFSESTESSGTTLKVQRGDTITAQFSGATGSTKTFPTTINFDSSSYFLNSIPHVTVTDKNIPTTDSIVVTVSSQKSGKQVQVTLTENGANDGTFGGTAPNFDHSVVLINGDQTASIGNIKTIRQIDSATTNTNFKFNQDSNAAEDIQVAVRSTTDTAGIPGGGLTLSETSANSGVFEGQLTVGGVTDATTINVAVCDTLTFINSKGLVANAFVNVCNDNTKKALEVSVSDSSVDTITASFAGSTVSKTVSFAGGESGGGGGGLVRPGLVVNILAGISVFGGGSTNLEPRTTLNSLKSDKSINIPDKVREVIDNFDPNVPIAPMDKETDFDFPLSINNKGYPIVGFTNTLQTNTVKAKEPISIKTVQYDQFKLKHISLYMNLHGTDDLFQSDTFITLNDGKLTVTDPHGYFENANIIVEVDKENKKREVIFDITFAKEMEKSNLVIKSWNDEKFSNVVNIRDAIQVSGISDTLKDNIMEKQEITPTDENQLEEKSQIINKVNENTPIPVDRGTVLDWAGYSSEEKTDKEVLDQVGIEGEKIPSWFKKNVGKLIYTEKVSLEEFVNALKFMEKNNLV